jgi:aminoglycoside 3-N-acetyltransferase
MADASDAARRLAEAWRQAGLREGDLVLIHSSISRTLRSLREAGVDAGPEAVLESFRHAVGPDGTLVLPLFNFDFADGEPFDIRHTPSQMGALTEAARTSPEAVRTGHPIYSFAVLGRRADEFRGVVNRSGYGADSPFGIIHRLGGKIAVLDLPDVNSMTFYHYVEELEAVPYRYHKEFSGTYVDADGASAERTFSLFVRDLAQGVVTDVDRMGEELWRQGLYRGDRPGDGSGLRVIEAPPFVDAVRDVIRAGRAADYLYSIQST